MQNDLIALLEPLFLAMPYASKDDQDDLDKIIHDLSFLPSNIEDVTLTVSNDGSSAVKAREGREVINIGLEPRIEEKENLFYNDVPLMLIELYKKEILSKDLLKLIFHKILKKNPDYVLMNKIISIFNIISILEIGSDEVNTILSESYFKESK